MSEYEGYPGGDGFEPWQDQEWPFHCDVPARYLGEVGEREIAELAAEIGVEAYVRQHDAYGGDPPIIPEMIPPHAPAPGEEWDSTIHHFRCVKCDWDLLLWDAN